MNTNQKAKLLTGDAHSYKYSVAEQSLFDRLLIQTLTTAAATVATTTTGAMKTNMIASLTDSRPSTWWIWFHLTSSTHGAAKFEPFGRAKAVRTPEEVDTSGCRAGMISCRVLSSSLKRWKNDECRFCVCACLLQEIRLDREPRCWACIKLRSQ